MLGFRKMIKSVESNPMPTIGPPPPPTPCPPSPIAVETSIQEQPTYKMQYENALKELGLKFLLTIDYGLDEWEEDEKPSASGYSESHVKWKDTYFITHEVYYGMSSTSHVRLYFYSGIHTFYSMSWNGTCAIPLDSNNPYVDGYLKIREKITFDKEQQEYHTKLNDLQDILGRI